MHGIVGFPMASLAWAAFHPVFYLHHNNVDRVYEKYITLEKVPLLPTPNGIKRTAYTSIHEHTRAYTNSSSRAN